MISSSPVMVILAGLAALAQAESPQTQTLREVLQETLSGNHALEAAKSKEESARSMKVAALGNFLPVVKLEATAQHLDRDLVFDLDPIREAMLQLHSNDAAQLQNLGGMLQGNAPMDANTLSAVEQAAYTQLDAQLPHFLDTIKEQDSWTGALVVYQPLFHGGRILAGTRVASARQQSAEAERRKKEYDLARDATKYYLQAALVRSSIRLRLDALSAMQKHMEQAQRLVTVGMTDRTAVLRAKAAIADGQAALALDSSRLQTLSYAIGQITGTGAPLLPTDTMHACPSVQDLPADAPVAEHATLRYIQGKHKEAEQGVQARTADFLPEVGAFARYELNRDALSDLEPNWVVGVKGSVVLFHGGADWNQREAAKATLREVQHMDEEATSLLELERQRQRQALLAAQKRYESLAAQEALTAEIHRATESKFEQGQATSLEVIDSWLAVQKAGLERLAAAKDGWDSSLEILWAGGRMDAMAETWEKIQ